MIISISGCISEKKLENGNLKITGQYCKYINHEFISMTFDLLKKNKVIITGAVDYNNPISSIDSLKYGNYQIRYSTIYNEQIIQDLQFNQDNELIKLCVDKLDYDLSKKNALIDRIGLNSSLKIEFESFGCFHFEELEFKVERVTRNQFKAIFNEEEKVLTTSDIDLIREFEEELFKEHSDVCTTSHNYKLSISNSDEEFKIEDRSCSWDGFDYLLNNLGFNL